MILYKLRKVQAKVSVKRRGLFSLVCRKAGSILRLKLGGGCSIGEGVGCDAGTIALALLLFGIVVFVGSGK